MSTRKPATIDAYGARERAGRGLATVRRTKRHRGDGAGRSREDRARIAVTGGDERPEHDDLAHVGIDPRHALELVRQRRIDQHREIDDTAEPTERATSPSGATAKIARRRSEHRDERDDVASAAKCDRQERQE